MVKFAILNANPDFIHEHHIAGTCKTFQFKQPCNGRSGFHYFFFKPSYFVISLLYQVSPVTDETKGSIAFLLSLRKYRSCSASLIHPRVNVMVCSERIDEVIIIEHIIVEYCASIISPITLPTPGDLSWSAIVNADKKCLFVDKNGLFLVF